jgi:hypothetical protein
MEWMLIQEMALVIWDLERFGHLALGNSIESNPEGL